MISIISIVSIVIEREGDLVIVEVYLFFFAVECLEESFLLILHFEQLIKELPWGMIAPRTLPRIPCAVYLSIGGLIVQHFAQAFFFFGWVATSYVSIHESVLSEGAIGDDAFLVATGGHCLHGIHEQLVVVLQFAIIHLLALLDQSSCDAQNILLRLPFQPAPSQDYPHTDIREQQLNRGGNLLGGHTAVLLIQQIRHLHLIYCIVPLELRGFVSEHRVVTECFHPQDTLLKGLPVAAQCPHHCEQISELLQKEVEQHQHSHLHLTVPPQCSANVTIQALLGLPLLLALAFPRDNESLLELCLLLQQIFLQGVQLQTLLLQTVIILSDFLEGELNQLGQTLYFH